MNLRNPTRHLSLLVLVLALVQGLALATAEAQRPARGNGKAKMDAAAQRTGMRSYTRTMRNGAQRRYYNIAGNRQVEETERALDRDSNVLEILHMGSPNAHHTLAIFDRQLLHTQFSQANHWRLRSWGTRLRPSSGKLYSAMIQLTDAEADRMRAMLAAADVEQGPEHLAGPNWERGHLRVSLGDRRLNCATTWCDMPVGEGGQPLWKIIGLRYSPGSARGLQRALETDGNERVFGYGVYGPDLPDFGTQPDRDVTEF